MLRACGIHSHEQCCSSGLVLVTAALCLHHSMHVKHPQSPAPPMECTSGQQQPQPVTALGMAAASPFSSAVSCPSMHVLAHAPSALSLASRGSRAAAAPLCTAAGAASVPTAASATAGAAEAASAATSGSAVAAAAVEGADARSRSGGTALSWTTAAVRCLSCSVVCGLAGRARLSPR
jgi:hypothetical protein